MIYVSTSCTGLRDIVQSVEKLNQYGFKNIELTGGMNHSENVSEVILDLKAKYSLNFSCHNYFPIPKEPFVMNLASQDDTIFNASYNLISKALLLSKKIGSDAYGFHAGYCIDLLPSELGEKIEKRALNGNSYTTFSQAVKKLEKQNNTKVKLYIENNVLSRENFKQYDNKSPFMFIDFESYGQLQKHVEFNCLLDVGHLKVSAATLKLNFFDELEKFFPVSHYLHLSDNDGIADQHKHLNSDSELYELLQTLKMKEKRVTLECYSDSHDNLKKLQKSYELVDRLI